MRLLYRFQLDFPGCNHCIVVSGCVSVVCGLWRVCWTHLTFSLSCLTSLMLTSASRRAAHTSFSMALSTYTHTQLSLECNTLTHTSAWEYEASERRDLLTPVETRGASVPSLSRTESKLSTITKTSFVLVRSPLPPR